MAMNINLEKAHDRVHWDFIEASLKVEGTPDIILWSGVPSPKFKSAKDDLIIFGKQTKIKLDC
ncbi:hypothetical protein J1N35_023259 [Gossypium stocksii]|uniref:Uncharacterized protein n=1 Tax=Gossypium stocksii TaxID=47602 RepID=A0A9D4A305_9ROSI|nr:hypothetical protein J1N35_023259 [Gossypium stocksii]